MKQIKPFGDDREFFFCAHCGGQTGTRDHIPSRVLLDTPYPENLPVVPCCQACNASFSSDEEYFAAFIDCALVGQTEPTIHHRPKVQAILERQPMLVESIQASVRHLPSRALAGPPNRPRLENVVLKLARGHAAFELHAPQLEPPTAVYIAAVTKMTDGEVAAFEAVPESGLFPEVGSRAMIRMFRNGVRGASWINVQHGRYRFLACPGAPLLIRLVLSEFLFCEVIWEDA